MESGIASRVEEEEGGLRDFELVLLMFCDLLETGGAVEVGGGGGGAEDGGEDFLTLFVFLLLLGLELSVCLAVGTLSALT